MKKIKFLIVRFSSIGDIVLTTPVVRTLKQQVEHSEIHFVTKAQYKPLLEHNPYIDQLHIFDGSFKNLAQSLSNIDFDYIIDLHKNLRSLRVKRLLKRVSFSFDKLNFQKWLYVTFKWNKLPDVHIVDRYMATTKPFDVKNDGKGLDYFFSPQCVIPESFKSFKEDYLGVVLGANHATKQIPENLMVNIIEQVNKPVVLLGGAKEVEHAARLESKLNVKTLNTCGNTTFDDSAYLLSRANVVLTPDTGMMHIAAALNKPIVSMWGNTVPRFGMYPYMKDGGAPSFIAEVEQLKCRPCSKIGYAKCPKNHFNCMMKQDVNQIVKNILSYWNIHD
ncbi:MAG: glycosyltransferase family 9 protein [Salinivirgaceae bacterium]